MNAKIHMYYCLFNVHRLAGILPGICHNIFLLKQIMPLHSQLLREIIIPITGHNMYTFRQCVLYRNLAGPFKICEPASRKPKHIYMAQFYNILFKSLLQHSKVERSAYNVYCANVIIGSGVEIPYVMNLRRIPKQLNPYFKILIFC